MRIIAFAGRKNSGKTELAKICNKVGNYHIILFANALKKLVSNIVGFEINETQESKEKAITKKITYEDYKLISETTNIDISCVQKVLEENPFNNAREALQIIGTNLIRKYNPNWHVEKLKEEILSDTSKDYVIDDLRFPNELDMVNELGGESWFIVRTSLEKLSNHKSETSLSWQDFGHNIIINDYTLNSFTNRWLDYFMYNIKTNEKFSVPIFGCNFFTELRIKICNDMDRIKDIDKLISEYQTNSIYFKTLCKKLLIPFELYTVEDKNKFVDSALIKEHKNDIKIINNFLTYKENNKRIKLTNHPLYIENAKMNL